MRLGAVVSVSGLKGEYSGWATEQYDPNSAWRAQASLTGKLLKQSVEVLQPGVFDDDSAAAVVILDLYLQAQGALQPGLHFAHIWINGGSRFCVFLRGLFWMQEALNVGLRLANRKRTFAELPSPFLQRAQMQAECGHDRS